jgi:hypothetical protein
MCAPLIASKYLAGVSLGCAVRAVRVQRLLLRLLVQLLRLLLQLGEATLGIDVNGILGDLALRALRLAHVCALDSACSRKQAHGGSGWRLAVAQGTYNVELLLECLRCLPGLVSHVLRPGRAREGVGDGFGVPEPPTWSGPSTTLRGTVGVSARLRWTVRGSQHGRSLWSEGAAQHEEESGRGRGRRSVGGFSGSLSLALALD